MEQIPSQIIILPFNFILFITNLWFRNIYRIFCVSQEEKTLEIRPIIGYAIIEVNEKKPNERDPNDIIRAGNSKIKISKTKFFHYYEYA